MSFRRTCSATPTFLTQLKSPVMMTNTRGSEIGSEFDVKGPNVICQTFEEHVSNDTVPDTVSFVSGSSSQRLRDEYLRLKLDNEAILRRISEDGALFETSSKRSRVKKRNFIPQSTNDDFSCRSNTHKMDRPNSSSGCPNYLSKSVVYQEHQQYPEEANSSQIHNISRFSESSQHSVMEEVTSHIIPESMRSSEVDTVKRAESKRSSFNNISSSSTPISEGERSRLRTSGNASEHEILKESEDFEKELEKRRRERDSLIHRLSQFVICNGELQNTLQQARCREDDLIQKLEEERMETELLRSETEILKQDLKDAIKTGDDLKTQLAVLQSSSQTYFSADEYTSSVKEELRQTTLLALEQQGQLLKLQETIICQSQAMKQLAAQIERQKKQPNPAGDRSSTGMIQNSENGSSSQVITKVNQTQESGTATPLVDEVFTPIINQLDDVKSTPLPTPIECLQISQNQKVSKPKENSKVQINKIIVQYPPSTYSTPGFTTKPEADIVNKAKSGNPHESHYLRNGPERKVSQSSSSISTRPTSQSSFCKQEPNNQQTLSLKVCPMCNALFDTRVSQDDFEQHVYSHF